MRTLALVITVGILTGSVCGQSFGGSPRSCFDRAASDLRSGDPVVVHLNDSSVIRGNRTIFALSSSFLYLMPLTDTSAAVGVSIPFERVNRLTYERQSSVTWLFTLVGFAVGTTAGVAIGVNNAPESKGFMDFSEVGAGIGGGIIGAVVGTVLGSEVGKQFKTTVTLRCP